MNFLPVVQFFCRITDESTTVGNLNFLPSLYVKKLYINVAQTFLPRTFVKFNGVISIEFANLEDTHLLKAVILPHASRSNK